MGPPRFLASLSLRATLFDPGNVLSGPKDLCFVNEGEFDVYAGLREKLPALGSWGSGLTRQQAAVLARFKKVVFLYDPDRAGVRGVARIKELYGGRLNWSALWLPAGQDAASMPPGWGKEVLKMAAEPEPDRIVSAMLSALKGV